MMANADAPTRKDVIVIGAGISGLVAAKCLKEDNLDVVILERTGEVGGLWTFREHDYGVMRFTHINVSKYNYCFSDYPFPEDTPDYPHHTDMAKYIVDYTKHFQLDELIRFQTKVLTVEKKGDLWHVTTCRMEDDGKMGKEMGDREEFLAKHLCIASGHHAKPVRAKFPGEETFKGEIIHSVDFKDAVTNGFTGKRVLIVGIGNSAVDAAVNCATEGRCKSVYISTRSGAWIIPNYVFGYPTDLYACRAFFLLPWRWATYILETVIKVISGSPFSWGLNPKMRALQTQPTVSPTLIHHIQRRNIRIAPNVLNIEGNTVKFVNGKSAEFDHIVYCTGYKIDLPYLPEDMTSKVLVEGTNEIKLYKNVFNPELGHSLAFIGFVQPASGGVLTMSETQARWFSELIKGTIRLPPKQEMEKTMRKEKKQQEDRWYRSGRHTIQRDPIVYNDEIANMFGAKPVLWKHPLLAWRLMFSSCGAYQWRLQGPHAWAGAEAEVKKVPMTDMMNYGGMALFVALFLLLFFCCFLSRTLGIF